MKTIREFIRRVLTEGKVEDLQKKYVLNGSEHGTLLLKAFNEFVAADPSPTKKYLEWMIKQFLVHEFNSMDITSTIEYFHRNIQRFQKKDINAYKTLKELEDTVKEIESKKSQKISGSGKAKKLYEDENFLLVRPDDKQAVQSYGANTRWCITMKNASYYEDYTSQNIVFYFMIDKKADKENEWSKVAITVYRKEYSESKYFSYEYYNAPDARCDKEEVLQFFDNGSEIGEKFLSLAENDAAHAPLPISVNLQRGTVLPDDEVIELWKNKFDEKARTDKSRVPYYEREKKALASKLTLAQQKKIATIDVYVAAIISLGGYFFEDGGKSGYVVFPKESLDKMEQILKFSNTRRHVQGTYEGIDISIWIEQPRTFIRLDDKKEFNITLIHKGERLADEIMRAESSDGEIVFLYDDREDSTDILVDKKTKQRFSRLTNRYWKRQSDGKEFPRLAWFDRDKTTFMLYDKENLGFIDVELSKNDGIYKDAEQNVYDKVE